MKKLDRHLITRYKIVLIPIVLVLLLMIYLLCTGWFQDMVSAGGTTMREGDELSKGVSSVVSHRKGEEQYFEFKITLNSGDVEIKIYDIDMEIDAEVLNTKTEEDFILVDTFVFTESQDWSFDLSEYPYDRNYLIKVVQGDDTDDYEFVYTYYTKKTRWRKILDKITGYAT